MITPIGVINAARNLRSENRTSPEYDRALVAMTSDLLRIDRELAEELVLGEGTIRV